MEANYGYLNIDNNIEGITINESLVLLRYYGFSLCNSFLLDAKVARSLELPLDEIRSSDWNIVDSP